MILRAVGESGKTAGVDFGLIGFNDDKLFQELSLSSLRPPVEDLGREAARNLIRMLQGETIPVQTRLQYQLIPRATPATQRR
jgi:DNA-binding LacI/PurR family transcriptional regulator